MVSDLRFGLIILLLCYDYTVLGESSRKSHVEDLANMIANVQKQVSENLVSINKNHDDIEHLAERVSNIENELKESRYQIRISMLEKMLHWLIICFHLFSEGSTRGELD